MRLFSKFLYSNLLLLTTFAHAALETPRETKTFTTYFQYNDQEIKELSELNSTAKMSNDELIKWDEITTNLSQNHSMGSDAARMYAYLYTAQRDAAFLSYNLKGAFNGSLGPISSNVLKLFFPAAPAIETDNYSEKLAQIVLTKVKQRLDDENAHMRAFPVTENSPQLTDFPKPCYGLKVATCKSWLLKDPKQFIASQPPLQNDIYWTQQAKVVEDIAKKATKEQIQASKFWAGDSWPKSGDSMVIANDYMFRHNTPFAKILDVRSILAEAGVDVDIALFYAKYTYLIKRPPIVNPNIPQHIAFPKHPSYPSGHSTWFPTWATILTHYFPKEKNHWFQLAEEAGQSRIWGGIHYPLDHQGGWALGVELGNSILQSPKIGS